MPNLPDLDLLQWLILTLLALLVAAAVLYSVWLHRLVGEADAALAVPDVDPDGPDVWRTELLSIVPPLTEQERADSYGRHALHPDAQRHADLTGQPAVSSP